MSEGHTLESLVVDLIASELAEGAADFIHKQIEEDAASSNFRITNRYSPGYCNWPVSEQQKLFTLMGKNTCGVILTPSSLMIPIKSVSGIVGIGAEVMFHGYACAKCDDAQCIYRNRK
jgi:cobalamin-dependent methionine synthase I